jgi:glycine cleavage system H lipoate-binding protein
MESSTHTVLPEGELFCVWMDAGLVNFKLCDKNFECESCPFDAVIRTHTADAGSPPPSVIKPRRESASFSVQSSEQIDTIIRQILTKYFQEITEIKLPPNRFYFSNHTWISVTNEQSYTIGIDHLLAHILTPVQNVIFAQPPTHLQSNAPCAWLTREHDTIVVHTPIAGSITEVNPHLNDFAILLNDDPYNCGWLLKITPAVPVESLKPHDHEHFLRVLEHDSMKLQESFLGEFQHQQRRLGTTMYDGGAVLDNIERIIGTKKFMEIIGKTLIGK